MPSDRCETDYMLVIDHRSNIPSVTKIEMVRLGTIPEERVAKTARAAFKDLTVCRVEVYSRQVTLAWEKVEVLLPESSFGVEKTA